MSYEEQNILIVEDEVGTNKALGKWLRLYGYTVWSAYDANEALKIIKNRGLPHLALIDLKLPGMHGFELADKIKRRHKGIPIIFITATHDSKVAIEGLSRYADDYVRKPFDAREVVTRVKRVLSRVLDFSYTAKPAIEVDERLVIDLAGGKATVDGKTVQLTPIEVSILSVLLRHAGTVVSSEALLRRVWPEGEVYEETLRVHMHRLRKKLETNPRKPRYILTERGVGYIFNMRPSSEVRR